MSNHELDQILELARRHAPDGAEKARAKLRALGYSDSICDAVAVAIEIGDASDDPDGHHTGVRVGERIELNRYLSSGGSGRVYQATYREDDGRFTPAAVKFFDIDDGERDSHTVREACARERKLLEQLSRIQKVPRLIEHGEHTWSEGGRSLYLCSENKHGLNLVGWCEEHELGTTARLRLFLQACDSVATLHEHGHAHGDLKPANLLVEDDGGEGRVWMLDLGLAAVLGKRWSEPGELIGTPGYMSLEQVSSDHGPVSERTDVYALGMILFELLEGRPWLEPRHDWSVEKLEQAMQTAQAPRLTLVRPAALRDRLNETLAQATALAPAQRYERVSALRMALTKAMALGPAADDATGRSRQRRTALGDDCPFRGLLAFEEEHEALFFGRETYVELLLGKLRTHGVLTLIGASGAGKSSLLRAGVVPAVRAGRLDARHSWTPVLLRPGVRPLRELALALSNLSGGSLPIDALAQRLREPSHLADELDRESVRTRPEKRFLIVVDQLEELFAERGDPADRRAFVAALLHASRAPEQRVRVVLALRADFTDRALAEPELGELIDPSHVLLGPMREDDLRRAIRGPAELAGLELEPGLEDLLVAAVRGEPGDLPLLQFVLETLWQRREGRYLTLAAYRDIGGLKGAIAHRADAELAELEDEGHGDAVRRLFRRLVQLGDGTPDTRRAVAQADLAGIHPAIDVVIQTLIEARLLTANQHRIEVAHEALIREWPRLREWIAEDRELLHAQQELEQATSRWKTSGETSDLWRGPRLARALELLGAQTLEPSADERGFLDASRSEAEREQRESAERQRHELEMTRELVASEQRKNKQLRWFLFAGLCLLLALGGITAFALRVNKVNEDIRTALDAIGDEVLSIAEKLEQSPDPAETRRDLEGLSALIRRFAAELEAFPSVRREPARDDPSPPRDLESAPPLEKAAPPDAEPASP